MNYKIPLIKDKIVDVLTSETVGFSRIPEQARKTSVERGFSFNLLIIGRRRSGTRTLVNNLFLSPILSENRPDTLSTTCAQITENGVKLNVRITTCHDFNKKKICEYLQNMNFSYFESNEGFCQENLSESEKLTDKRVHITIFLLSTDNVSDEEMKVVKCVSEQTNLLCVIGKADTYMENELSVRKREISKILEDWRIDTFKPSYDPESTFKRFNIEPPLSETASESERIAQEKPINMNMKKEVNLELPLAIVASESLFKINGQTRRGRLYRWGFVDVNDMTYNDFLIMRRILIGTNMEEIKEVFERCFYENYRLDRLKKKDFTLRYRSEKLLELYSEWRQIPAPIMAMPAQLTGPEEPTQSEDVFAIIEN